MRILDDGQTRVNEGPAARRDRLGTALGWFSVGLGTAEIATPGAITRIVGVDNSATNRVISRTLCGTRELAAGLGIFGDERPGRWLWGRVGGDAIDLSLLTAGVYRHRHEPTRLARLFFATGSVIGVTVLDVIAARRHAGPRDVSGHTARARATTTVRRTPEDLYRRWHDFEALPTFMYHLDSVHTTNGISHWKAKGPAGMKVEWDAEIVDDRPDELIAWRSVRGSKVHNAGTVRFLPAPGDRGTEVHVDLTYDIPGGTPGYAVAKLLGEEPSQQITDDLRRFKQLMETGEIVRSEGSPTGARNAVHLLRQHPAQPLG